MEKWGGQAGGDLEVGGYGIRRGRGSGVWGRRRVQLPASGQAVPMCRLLQPRHHAVFPVQGCSVLVRWFRNFLLDLSLWGLIKIARCSVGFDSCVLLYSIVLFVVLNVELLCISNWLLVIRFLGTKQIFEDLSTFVPYQMQPKKK